MGKGVILKIEEKLSRLMEMDAYAGPDGMYEIHSLYFDVFLIIMRRKMKRAF